MRNAPRFVLLGNARSVRVQAFNVALVQRGLAPATLVPWRAWLRGEVSLPEVVRAGDLVRIESPGRDWEVEKLLLQRGAAAAENENFAFLPAARVAKLSFETGRLWPSRQWFHGLAAALRNLQEQLAACEAHTISHCAADVEVFCDKPRCHEILQSAGVPVPRSFGVPQNFDDLAARLQAASCHRVFVKLAHGSSAAGVVAYESDGRRHRAVTTTEVVRQSGQVRLYNSRRVRVLTKPAEIAELIDALCRERVHSEEWVPKASFRGRSCDLRVLVVAGRARHCVARLSRHPLTNLHLLNERAEGEELRAAMPEASWAAAMHSGQAALRCFPRSLAGGVDLLFTPGFRRHAILEINAWGDLLHGALHEAQDAYAAQIAAMQAAQAQIGE